MTEQQNTDVNTTSPQKKLLLLLIILVVVAAVISGGYLGLNLVINKINTATTKTEEALDAIKQLQVKYNQLQSNSQDLQKEIQKSTVVKVKYWQPIMIEHLVNLADLALNTTQDTKLAISFLSAARQYANDPELSAINHALNKDIADLQAVPMVDASELILKIEAINQKINSLPIIATGLNKAAVLQKTSGSPSEIKPLWQRFLTSTINSLKDMVIIRHQAVDPLLSPEQETVLRLVIQTKLLQAELAVMHRQNKLYHSCLEETTNLVTRYFAANQTFVADILSTLQELQRMDLEPKLPFPTESIAAVKNFISANKPPVETQPQSRIIPQNDGAPLL